MHISLQAVLLTAFISVGVSLAGGWLAASRNQAINEANILSIQQELKKREKVIEGTTRVSRKLDEYGLRLVIVEDTLNDITKVNTLVFVLEAKAKAFKGVTISHRKDINSHSDRLNSLEVTSAKNVKTLEAITQDVSILSNTSRRLTNTSQGLAIIVARLQAKEE